MATYYWVGNSGNWSNSAKWSLTSGGAGGAGVPGSADTAIVNGASMTVNSTITIDTTVTVATLTISSVDVMVTLGSAQNLTVTGACAISVLSAIQSYGLTISGNATFGSLTLTSGTLSLGSSNITVKGAVVVSGSVARTLAFGTGSITINLNVSSSTTVWSGATLTSFTVTGSRNVNFIFTGNTFPVTINHGSTTGGNGNTAISIASITSSILLHSVTAAGHFIDFNFGSFTKTLVNSTRTIYGSITLNSSMTLNSGLLVTTISNNGINKTITSNGKIIDFPLTINSIGLETITLNDALTMGSSRTLTLTSGVLELNGFTLTCGRFSSSNTNSRTIIAGYDPIGATGGEIILNSGTLTGSDIVWNCPTVTNFSLVNVSVSVICNASTAGIVANINHGATSGGSSSNKLNIKYFNTNNSVLVVTTTGHYGSLVLSDPNGVLNVTTGTMTIYNELTVGTTTVVNPSSFVTTLSGAGITTNGVTLNFPVTAVNGCTLFGAVTLSNNRTFTLTSGNVYLNGFTLTCGIFSTSGSSTRNIYFDDGNIVISSSIVAATTVWNCPTITNFGFNGNWNVSFNVTGNFTATIYHGPTGASVSNAFPSLTNPTVEGSLTIIGHYIDVDLSGISNTINAPTFSIYRDVKFSSNSILTEATGELTFVGTTYDKSITTNGNTFNSNIRVNSQGTTVFLNGDLVCNKGITITAGTIDANNYNLTTKSVSLFGTGDKGIKLGSGTWIINGSSVAVSGDIYTWLGWNLETNANNPSLTFDKGTGNIVLSAFSDSHTINFKGGGLEYNKVSVVGDYINTIVNIYGNNTFSELESLKSTSSTVSFAANTITNVNNWSLNGTANNILNLNTIGTGSHTFNKVSGVISASYVRLSNSTTTGGATWNAYTSNGNIDNGNNSGWIFTALVVVDSNSGNFFAFF